MEAVVSPAQIAQLQQEFRTELVAIADWWATHSLDHQHGGFHGEISSDNKAQKNANKGLILNARILWFFSEVSQIIQNNNYQQCAQRAYVYFINYFLDKKSGGFFWELDAQGNPVNTRKQIYGQAFAIYALCAYFQLTREPKALQLAQACFALIETHAKDNKHDGYVEAFTHDWKEIDDFRLSEKDLNYPKSQNTHLHILEAYTRLHQIDNQQVVAAALRYNIELFDKYIIDKDTHHLRMFMSVGWQDFSPGYTYGHDIEAAWLIAEALDALGNDTYTQYLSAHLLAIAQTTLNEGIGNQGQVIDGYDFSFRRKNTGAVWWVQAEALVGFCYAFKKTKDIKFYQAAFNNWAFIKQYQKDNEHGEWRWLASIPNSITEKYSINHSIPNYKAGFWKCPYHNGRAMIEASRNLDSVLLETARKNAC